MNKKTKISCIMTTFNKTQKTLVSVILPTYNWKPEWLSESIESVLNQTFKDFELIIINDASNNNIEETILKYRDKDPRIVYLKNEKNLKLVKTLNRGIEHSKWKYIARIDDDDIWINKDKLKKQVNFMEDNEDYWLCWTEKIVVINEQWKQINVVKNRTSDNDIRNHILQSNQFVHSSILIRKTILNNVWVYDPKYNKAEDYEVWCRIWTKYKFTNLENIAIKYRINSKWVSMNNFYYQKRLSFKICLKYLKYYPNFIKAMILRIWDFMLPENLKNHLLKLIIKSWKINK